MCEESQQQQTAFTDDSNIFLNIFLIISFLKSQSVAYTNIISQLSEDINLISKFS